MPLYHYCSNDTFLSILRNSEIWLSELTLSNDSMEGKWLQKLLLEKYKETEKDHERLTALSNILEAISKKFRAFGFCLSAHGDTLSQWREYADKGEGVAIGFADGKDTFPHFQITKIIYIENKCKELIDGILSNTKRAFDLNEENVIIKAISEKTKNDIDILELIGGKENDQLIIDAVLNSFSVKNPAFEEEKERRILYKVTLDRKLLRYENEKIDFHSRGD